MRRAVRAALTVAVAMAVGLPPVHGTPPPPPSATAKGDVLELEANVRLTHPEVSEGGEAPGDLAFWGDLAVVGRGIFSKADRRHNGFVLFDISNPAHPREVSRFDCTNTGFDVSVWGDLVFLSQDQPSETDDCGAPATGPAPPATAFAGLRIISIADPARPVPIAAIKAGLCRTNPTCPTGSHTHTVVPDLENDRLVVYVNAAESGIVEVPLQNPAGARYVGEVSNLARGTRGINGCHDLQVHLASRLAACGAIDMVTLWDITDLLEPVVFAHFAEPTISHHHSANFSVDANTLVLQDESLVSFTTEVAKAVDDGCLDVDAGALRFFDISQTVADYRAGRPVPSPPRWTATLRPPVPVTEEIDAWCVGHYGNVIPIPADAGLAVRNLLVIGWGGAGTWLVDFTDPADPRPVGHYYDTGSETEPPSFAASSYWYRGRVYVNNGSINFFDLDHRPTDRGLEVLRIQPGDDAYGKQLRLALSRADRPHRLNPQTLECVGPCSKVARPQWAPGSTTSVGLAPRSGPLVMGCRIEGPRPQA